jgi:uncharacterized protein YdiU (UPF0061 family)
MPDFAWNFDNTYARLPSVLYRASLPRPVRAPSIVLVNEALARDLALPELDAPLLSGNRLPPGAQPIAQAYAGHQFGHFTLLGDGRALLLGEHIAPNQKRVDIQLKGSGPTVYSRGGDGRAALGPMLREYIVSEALHALGIPTTRSLAVVATGESVIRETPLPGAVLTRVAASHIRIGTFEYAFHTSDLETLSLLTRHTLHRHFPDAGEADNPALALLDAVVESQASLVARWMNVGFVHGVMNTDNTALSGETIDYGPCAFLDRYDPATVFSSIDQKGRYTYGNQPRVLQWNLARFAETLLPLLDPDETCAMEKAQASLERFPSRYQHHWLQGMRAKLGLFTEENGDPKLAHVFLEQLKQSRSDFTLAFAELDPQTQEQSPFHQAWRERLTRQPQSLETVRAHMQAHNPIVIARNHQVEAVLRAAHDQDLKPLLRLLAALQTPFERNHSPVDLCQPPPPGTPAFRSFCGT